MPHDALRSVGLKLHMYGQWITYDAEESCEATGAAKRMTESQEESALIAFLEESDAIFAVSFFALLSFFFSGALFHFVPFLPFVLHTYIHTWVPKDSLQKREC